MLIQHDSVSHHALRSLEGTDRKRYFTREREEVMCYLAVEVAYKLCVPVSSSKVTGTNMLILSAKNCCISPVA